MQCVYIIMSVCVHHLQRYNDSIIIAERISARRLMMYIRIYHNQECR